MYVSSHTAWHCKLLPLLPNAPMRLAFPPQTAAVLDRLPPLYPDNVESDANCICKLVDESSLAVAAHHAGNDAHECEVLLKCTYGLDDKLAVRSLATSSQGKRARCLSITALSWNCHDCSGVGRAGLEGAGHRRPATPGPPSVKAATAATPAARPGVAPTACAPPGQRPPRARPSPRPGHRGARPGARLAPARALPHAVPHGLGRTPIVGAELGAHPIGLREPRIRCKPGLWRRGRRALTRTAAAASLCRRGSGSWAAPRSAPARRPPSPRAPPLPSHFARSPSSERSWGRPDGQPRGRHRCAAARSRGRALQSSRSRSGRPAAARSARLHVPLRAPAGQRIRSSGVHGPGGEAPCAIPHKALWSRRKSAPASCANRQKDAAAKALRRVGHPGSREGASRLRPRDLQSHNVTKSTLSPGDATPGAKLTNSAVGALLESQPSSRSARQAPVGQSWRRPPLTISLVCVSPFGSKLPRGASLTTCCFGYP